MDPKINVLRRPLDPNDPALSAPTRPPVRPGGGKSSEELARLRAAIDGGTYSVDPRIMADRILADET